MPPRSRDLISIVKRPRRDPTPPVSAAQMEANQALQALLQQAEDSAVYARSVHQGAPERELATPTLDEVEDRPSEAAAVACGDQLRYICRR